MKAKLRGTTGAYFDVTEVNACLVKDSIPFVRYFADDEGTIYDEQQLEFETYSPKEITIEGWVARDREHCNLFLYSHKPRRAKKRGYWIYGFESGTLLPIESFPSVTWETEPKKVRITVTPIEE